MSEKKARLGRAETVKVVDWLRGRADAGIDGSDMRKDDWETACERLIGVPATFRCIRSVAADIGIEFKYDREGKRSAKRLLPEALALMRDLGKAIMTDVAKEDLADLQRRSARMIEDILRSLDQTIDDDDEEEDDEDDLFAPQ